MCCGERARQMDLVLCQWLYRRHLAGEPKRLLCAQFRIRGEDFDRVLAAGKAAGDWSPIPVVPATPLVFLGRYKSHE